MQPPTRERPHRVVDRSATLLTAQQSMSIMKQREEAKAAAEQEKANRQASREQAQVAKQAAMDERRAALAAKEAERASRRDMPTPLPSLCIPPRPPLFYSAARAASLERYRAKRAARHTLEAQKRRRTV
jgi:hypothetical protein